MTKKQRITITIDPRVVNKTKEIAGLVPLSRFVESLLRKEIERHNSKQGGAS